jgi:hypothetical protein
MTVEELIAELKQCDPNAKVHFAYNYGDHWRTEVAPTVDVVEMGQVKYSDYHRMPKVVQYDAEDDEDYNTNDQEGQVVILR